MMVFGCERIDETECELEVVGLEEWALEGVVDEGLDVAFLWYYDD